MNISVNELLSNPAFRPLVLLDVLAVFLMIICLVFRRMRKGYYVEQANDARKATMLNIAVRNVTGMGVYSAPGYWARRNTRRSGRSRAGGGSDMGRQRELLRLSILLMGRICAEDE